MSVMLKIIRGSHNISQFPNTIVPLGIPTFFPTDSFKSFFTQSKFGQSGLLRISNYEGVMILYLPDVCYVATTAKRPCRQSIKNNFFYPANSDANVMINYSCCMEQVVCPAEAIKGNHWFGVNEFGKVLLHKMLHMSTIIFPFSCK